MRIINRNAYIIVAVKGTGYCRSASRAVSLLLSNALRVATASVVTAAFIWYVLKLFGKVSLAIGLMSIICPTCVTFPSLYCHQKRLSRYPKSFGLLANPLTLSVSGPKRHQKPSIPL